MTGKKLKNFSLSANELLYIFLAEYETGNYLCIIKQK